MKAITYGSVCSGIEAATVAWHPLGWKAVWFAEIEPFPSAVLAHHYASVPNLGDMTTIARRILSGEVEAPDILVGGTPCQAFSVAGARQSLDDARGNLTLRFMELANAIDFVRLRAGKPPVRIVWENVPGVLSTKDNAFGCFLGGLAGEDVELVPPRKRWSNAGCVYGPARAIAWRTLDAQYFGLAQRRKRVFVVASAADGFDPAQVLLEWESVRRDSSPRRASGQVAAASLAASAGHHGYSSARGDGSDNLVAATLVGSMHGDHEGRESHLVAEVSPTIPSRSKAGGGMGTDFDLDGGLVAFGGNDTSGPIDVATARNAHGGPHGRLDFESETFVVGEPPHAFDARQTDVIQYGDKTGPLDTDGQTIGVLVASAVRRLTPVECERLQGFPDGYTQVPFRGKPAADGPRYKSVGNSMATEVMAWLGRRINSHLIRLGEAA